MKHGITLLSALGLGLCLGAGSFAQERAPVTPVAPSDRAFMATAAEGGMAEVTLGKLANSRAANPAVKEFGKRMVEDHSMANQELMDLAKTRSVRLPADLKPEHKALRDRLSKLQGAEFDRLYMSEMVKDHKEDVGEFKRASNTVKDPELKNWVVKTLPTLEDHLKMSQDIYASVSKAPAAANRHHR